MKSGLKLKEVKDVYGNTCFRDEQGNLYYWTDAFEQNMLTEKMNETIKEDPICFLDCMNYYWDFDKEPLILVQIDDNGKKIPVIK